MRIGWRGAIWIGALILAFIPTACSQGPGSVSVRRGPDGPAGIETTLSEARRLAGYPISLPTDLPAGLEIAMVYHSGGPPETLQVLVQYSDGSFIEFLPRTRPPDYTTTSARAGRGRLVTVRGVPAFTTEPDRAAGSRGLVRWFESGLEIVIGGFRPLDDYLLMAESIP